ncbi:MAG: T9SS type A sorting domain-containing protein [Bacteroidota bacterium]
MNKKKYRFLFYFICVLCFINSKIQAQANLVLNPGFEMDSFCTSLHDGIIEGAAYNWRSANLEPMFYLNICANQFNDIEKRTTIPFNFFGFQIPHRGIAYALFGPYANWNDGHSYRQYPKGTLKDTLVAGKRYGIQYYISKSEFWNYYRFCISNIGFYFSDTSIFYNNSDKLPLIPQYRNDTLNALSDTLGWQKVEGTYLASGGERYFIIGNFDDNAHTKIFDCFNNGADLTSPTGEIFYYIDDVAVIDTSLIDTVHLCLNDSVFLEGAWRKNAGLYFDTVAGLPYRKYIQPISYAETHTNLFFEGLPTDTFKTVYFWSRIFAGKDTTFTIVMPSVYGCDSIIFCRLRDKSIGIQNPIAYESASLKIYPNPSTDIINIDIKLVSTKNQKTKDFKLFVYDMMGKQVNCNFTLKNNTEANISYQGNINKLSVGMYFVKVYSPNNNTFIGTGRFVKE